MSGAKRILRALSGAAVVAVAAGGLAVSPAHAATPPPWEPDANSAGGLLFFDAAGNQITSGDTSDPIPYILGTSTVRGGDNVATLYGYLPVAGKATGEWGGEVLTGSTTYPNASAPGALATTSLPLVTGSATDETIAELATDYPNTASGTDGYAHTYQLRLLTSKPQEGISTTYDSADLLITGSTWTVAYSQAPAIHTAVGLSVKPAGPVVFGDKVKLTATISPTAATGSVQFKEGSKVLKTVPVASGKATFATSHLSGGSHKIVAKFVPATSSYASSTSASKTVKVKPVATKTSLLATDTSLKVGDKLTLKVTEKPVLNGKATIYDGSKKLGTVKVKVGKATFSTTKLGKGTHKVKARFVPANSADAAKSTSKVIKVTVKG